MKKGEGDTHPCGRANNALPGEGITVPVELIDDADDESSSWGVFGTDPDRPEPNPNPRPEPDAELNPEPEPNRSSISSSKPSSSRSSNSGTISGGGGGGAMVPVPVAAAARMCMAGSNLALAHFFWRSLMFWGSWRGV